MIYSNNKKKSIKKIVLFGGAFSPFHLGHLKICQSIHKKINPDFFFLLPYQKLNNNKNLIKNNHRIEMIKQNIKDLAFLSLSLFEINNKSISYSFITCNYFRRLYPDAKIYFVLGTDCLNDFFNWEKNNEILTYCNLLHVFRKKETIDKNIKILINNNLYKDTSLFGNIYHLDSVIPKISSTQIRKYLAQFLKKNKLAKAKKLAKLVKPNTLNYLIKNFKELY